MKLPTRVFVLASVVMALLVAVYASASSTVSIVTIARDGSVSVYIKTSINRGLNSIPAPVEPLLATIDARLNGSSLAPIVYSDGLFYFYSDTQGFIEIRYMANITLNNDGSIEFRILNTTTTVQVEPGIVLLKLPENIRAAEYSNNVLKLVVEGPTSVRYIVVERPITATTTTTPTTPTTTPAPTTTTTQAPSATVTSPTQTPSTTTPSTTSVATTTTTTPTTLAPAETITPGTTSAGENRALWVIVMAIAAIILILLGYFVSSHRKSTGAALSAVDTAIETSTVLDETDQLILDILEKSGGTILQSELLRVTGLPKATLWRHVRKLERLGYIRVVREGKANKLILVKRK